MGRLFRHQFVWRRVMALAYITDGILLIFGGLRYANWTIRTAIYGAQHGYFVHTSKDGE